MTLTLALLLNGTALADGGPERTALAAASVASFAAGAAWYFGLGDTYGAGDPASLLVGGGLVGLGGVALGAAASRTGLDGRFRDGVGTPSLALGMDYGGGAWAGEASPHTASLAIAPRIALSERVSLKLASTVSSSVSPSLDVDPRPQGASLPSLSATERGVDLAPEVRWGVSPRVQLQARSMVWARQEQLTYANGDPQTLRRVAVLPAVVGGSIALSDSQRFGLVTGPRFDWVGVTGSDVDPWLGPWYGEAFYDVQMTHGRWLGAPAASRVRVTYVHANFDGAGFNAGAMVGFAGPFHLDWDVRLVPDRGRTAWQVGLDADLADGGGLGISMGIGPGGNP